MAPVPFIDGLRVLADRYDAFVIDLWGVMHDGITAFPDAVACLEVLKEQGKKTIILSNAPRRAEAVAQRNEELGIRRDLCDVIMSSGEVAWRHLADRSDPWYRQLGHTCYHLGPDRDHGMRDGLDYDFTEDLQKAEFVLLTGALSQEDRVEDYDDLLDAAVARRLPMVCANPDLEVIRGGKREICAGAIALSYENKGGEVRYHGKPHQDVYEVCLSALGGVAPDRVAGIGDSFRTDIAGALASGMGAIFVVGGIHEDELGVYADKQALGEQVTRLGQEAKAVPQAALQRLIW